MFWLILGINFGSKYSGNIFSKLTSENESSEVESLEDEV